MMVKFLSSNGRLEKYKKREGRELEVGVKDKSKTAAIAMCA